MRDRTRLTAQTTENVALKNKIWKSLESIFPQLLSRTKRLEAAKLRAISVSNPQSLRIIPVDINTC